MLDLDVSRPTGHADMPLTFAVIKAWPTTPDRRTDYTSGVSRTYSVWLDTYHPPRSYYSDDPALPWWVRELIKEEV